MVATGMESLKMYSLCQVNKRTSGYGQSNYEVSFSTVFADNGNLRKFGATYRLGTVLAPKQC